MAANRLALLLVGSESVLPDFEDDVKACSKAVGAPMKVFTAWRAHEAVSKLQACIQAHGYCSAVFLSERFTAKGKEEYSDVVRKVLREKHPNVPVVCWGSPQKGGTQGKDYHVALEWKAGDRTSLAKVLLMVKNGEIDVSYKAKGKPVDIKKEEAPRKSLDAAASPVRRRSTEGSAPAPSAAAAAAAPLGSARRKSMEMTASPSPIRISLDTARSGSSMTAVSSGLLQGAGVPVAGMGMMGMGRVSSARGSFEVHPLNGAMGSYGMVPSPRGSMDMSPLNGALAGTGMTMMFQKPMNLSPLAPAGLGMPGPMQGQAMQPASFSQAPPPPAPAVQASNAAMIRALADEVARLKALVEQKRAREAAAAYTAGAPTPPDVAVAPSLQ